MQRRSDLASAVSWGVNETVTRIVDRTTYRLLVRPQQLQLGRRDMLEAAAAAETSWQRAHGAALFRKLRLVKAQRLKKWAQARRFT